MFDNLREDTRRLRETKKRGFPWYVLESLVLDAGYQAVVLHRLAHWFRSRGVPFLGPAIARYNLHSTGADISPYARFGPGLRISHPCGIVVGWEAVVGRDCPLMQNVTLGAPTTARLGEMPIVGDRVTLAAGATVIGRVVIGDDVFVGAQALVLEDVPARSKVLARTGVEVRPRSPRPSLES
jgi:serine O-acetyltransferase